MTGSLPVLKPREVVALLEGLGFVEVRQRGSHRQYRHADGRGTTVPFHGSRDISPTLLRKIARDIGLTVEEHLVVVDNQTGGRTSLTHEEHGMTKHREVVVGRWRIVETEVWGPDALDLVVPAYIRFDRNGLGEMQLIAIGASIDYRVAKSSDGPIVDFSWSGFDEGDPTSGRGSARVDGDTMRGRLFIHQGDDSVFVARREPIAKERSGSNKPLKPSAGAQTARVPATRRVRRGRS